MEGEGINQLFLFWKPLLLLILAFDLNFALLPVLYLSL
jgi:hypothetical protein